MIRKNGKNPEKRKATLALLRDQESRQVKEAENLRKIIDQIDSQFWGAFVERLKKYQSKFDNEEIGNYMRLTVSDFQCNHAKREIINMIINMPDSCQKGVEIMEKQISETREKINELQ